MDLKITSYDLGGSQGFRGIWPRYYHEVHGFVFVVDSADSARLAEASLAFKDFLKNPKVKGKPLLLLCNKSDLEEAQDEIHIVDKLNVERLVNDSKCPTRVEQTIAAKNQVICQFYETLSRYLNGFLIFRVSKLATNGW